MKKLTIVGLCLACTGLVLLTAVALTGGFKQVLSAERLPDFVRSAVPFSGDYQKTDKSIRLADEAIESIEVDLSMGAFEIRVGDIDVPTLSYQEVKSGDDLLYEIRTETKDKVLFIDDYYKAQRLFFVPGPNIDPKQIVLTLPQDLLLSRVSISLSMGKTDVADLKAKELELKLDMGGARLDNVNLGFARLNLSMGSLELSGGQIRGSEIDLDMGSINSDAELRGRQSIECSMGSADLKLPFSLTQINYEADLAMGSLYVDGQKTSDLIHREGINVSADFNFEMSMGSVRIELLD